MKPKHNIWIKSRQTYIHTTTVRRSIGLHDTIRNTLHNITSKINIMLKFSTTLLDATIFYKPYNR